MILTCPQCATSYQADASKFAPPGRNVRCAKCAHVWFHALEGETEKVEPDASAAPEPAPAPPEPEAEAEPETEDEIEAQPVSVAKPLPVRVVPSPPPRPAVPWTQRGAVLAGWAGLVLVVLVVGWTAVHYRQDVAMMWPQSASLYSKLGLRVNARGIAFTGVSYRRETEDGTPVLAVSGQLVNVSNRALPVPQIRVALTDDARRELYHWTFVPSVLVLRPGQVVPFLTRLASPPPGARHLELRFAQAGE